MRIDPIEIPRTDPQPHDIDVAGDGRVAAVTSGVRVTEPGKPYDIDLSKTRLYIDGTHFRLPREMWYPIARWLPSGALLVADSRRSKPPNAYILEEGGTVRAEFDAGDGIQDIVVAGDHIVVTYFDEGVFGGTIAHNGICAFDLQGRLLWGFHSVFGYDRVSIADCYAICAVDEHSVVFCAYTEFDVVYLDLAPRILRITKTPDELHGCGAITTYDGTAFLHGPYNSRSELYALNLDDGSMRHVEDISGVHRGLPNGRFLVNRGGSWGIASVVS